MSMSEQLKELLHGDVDDIVTRGRAYDSRTRFRVIRYAAEQFATLDKPVDRVKAMWIVQALLSLTDDRQLPYTTSSKLAPRLASIVESKREELDVRRSALDSLALVFVKTKQLTRFLDMTIWMAFVSALDSDDAEMRGFASEALSGGGILTQRSLRGPNAKSDFTSLRRDALKEMRNKIDAILNYGIAPLKKPAALSRKAARRQDTERSHKRLHSRRRPVLR
jgi:hypothetical protein